MVPGSRCKIIRLHKLYTGVLLGCTERRSFVFRFGVVKRAGSAEGPSSLLRKFVIFVVRKCHVLEYHLMHSACKSMHDLNFKNPRYP